MSILTDLETAWAAVDAARKTLAEPLPISEIAYLEREEALYSALGTYHKLLTDDTIAALVAVARAVDKGKLTTARHALYPLVKEANDE